VPDPNGFDGPVKIYKPREGKFFEIPLSFDYPENSRALGLADMAKAIEENRPARASSDLTYHVLEVMTAFGRSAESHAHIDIKSAPERPEPMKKSVLKGIIG